MSQLLVALALAVSHAQAIAVSYWGAQPCGGQVAIAGAPMLASVNANSVWTITGSDLYADPEANTGCRIVFNRDLAWTWPKFCTVMVHEYGHLLGHPHSGDPADVMYPLYLRPLPACARRYLLR